jgi:hypothetical protein
MRIKVRYLSSEIAEYFQSSEKVEMITLYGAKKYKDLLEELERRVVQGSGSKSTLKNFVVICNGHRLSDLENEPLVPNSEVIVAHADTGG